MQSTEGTTKSTDPVVEIVKARRAEEAHARAAQAAIDAPIIEQRRRKDEARKTELLAELETTLQDFIARMKETGYPGAQIFTIAEEYVTKKGPFRRTRYSIVEVVGWTIGFGNILLVDGRLCTGAQLRDRVEAIEAPFKRYNNDMIEDLINSLKVYPEKV